MTKSLVEQRTDLLVEIRDISAKAETEQGGVFTDDQRETLTDRMAKARDLTDQITKAATAKAFAGEVGEFLSSNAAEEVNADALHGSVPGFKGRAKSLGRYFTDSEQFKAAMGESGGREVGKDTHFALRSKVPVAGGLKALIGTDPAGNESGAGVLWDPQRIPTVQATWPELKLRNVITVGETSSDSIVYARILRAEAGGSVSNAAGVPEAVSAGPISASGTIVTPVQAGLKPESSLKFAKVTAPVITIAHWVPATKKALSDAGQLRTLIDNFLRRGLEAEWERQIIGGDASAGEEFDGLINTDGIQVQAFTTNILVTIRKALTKVRKYGRANGILVSPATAERIDLLRTSTGQYLGPGAFGPAISAVWRTPVVEVPGLADSTVLVGDFSTAVVWDREDVTITATDSHLDFFTRNLVAILAEARAAFGVLDPALIVKATVTGTDDIIPAVTD